MSDLLRFTFAFASDDVEVPSLTFSKKLSVDFGCLESHALAAVAVESNRGDRHCQNLPISVFALPKSINL